jgi:CitB family two-component system response regulator MalR
MTGLDLLSQIRTIDTNVDVIIVSAACDSHSIQKALRYGAVDYLIKPFEFERFNTALSAYRDRSLFIKGQSSIKQAELDQKILLKDQPLLNELPKGLGRSTLNIVWEYIREGAENPFTTEEMAKRVGISRVSMRKYLTFLMKLDILRMEVTFGSIGRPVYKYRCINTKTDFIKRFQ